MPPGTALWVDETYAAFAGEGTSLESLAATRPDVMVCTSFSKTHALSGLRVGYLCAHPARARALRRSQPPWQVGLVAQVGALAALESQNYYRARYAQTAALQEGLAQALSGLGCEVVPSAANFLLVHLPPRARPATEVAAACRRRGLHVRELGSVSPRLAADALRITVLDEHSNRRTAEILAQVLEG